MKTNHVATASRRAAAADMAIDVEGADDYRKNLEKGI
jgi:hypothetical protein